ncbi:MAG: protein kinase [Planctomycetota bacterium]
MAQSYDVYFARMILTMELVEREAIQAALHAYQQAGGGVGFPKWLVEHQLLDKVKVKKVADELEKWFKAARARSESEEERMPLGIEDEDEEEPVEAELVPDEQSQPPSAAEMVRDDDEDETGASSSADLEIPPDESGIRAVPPAKKPAPAASQPTSSRPNIVIPTDRPATPRAQPRPQVQVSKGGTPPVALPRPVARPDPNKKSSARQALPAEPAAPAPRESARLKKTSARLKKPSAEELAPVSEKPPEKPPEKFAEKSPEKPAEKPPERSRSGRLKPASTSGRLVKSGTTPVAKPPAEVAAKAPPPVSADKQWALFDKATKDPLARLIGARLGRTEILKLINTADIVTNFEGRHGDDERAALVKVLRPEKVKDKVALERFTREAQALVKIDHPNIARILESGVAEGVRYISMEIGGGEPLSETLARVGRLPPERVAKMIRGVSLGLAAAHRAGIIHRDLRPANILVEDGGTVKLIGFGIARDVSVPGRLTATGHITGHPSYVAPEVAQSLEITPRVDVYSLGIVLFLALAGRLPFESRSVVKLVGFHLNAPPPKLVDVLQGCPPKLSALVERCLAKDPAARPEAMDVANALAAKDLLEGFDAQKWKDEAKKPDTEEELRRAMATDEHPSVDASAESSLGGPACAACELPIGLKSVSLHGNQICSKCVERVESLELCAACLLEIEEKDANATDVAVFAGHIYCRSCTRRVRLPCATCRKEAALSGLASGQTKAKGDQLVHAICPKG